METSTALLTLCAIHRSPVNSPHKGQWRGALMFSLICTWTNDWVNNRDHDMIFVKMTASSAASDDNFIKTTRLLFQWRWMHSNTVTKQVLIHSCPRFYSFCLINVVVNFQKLPTATDLYACILKRLTVNNRHDDVIKWKHFPRHWPFVRGIHRSPVNSPQKGQWRVALVFSLICAWTNGWVNIRDVGDLRRHGAYYDVIIMDVTFFEVMDVIAKLRTLHVMTTQSYGPSFESNGFHRVFIPLSFHYLDNCDTWNLPSIAIN